MFTIFAQFNLLHAQIQTRSTKSSDEELKEKLLTKFKKYKKLTSILQAWEDLKKKYPEQVKKHKYYENDVICMH